MTRLEDIKIYAYLSPDPLDDDSMLEEDWISWFPGYKCEETEEGLPSFYHDENIGLYRKIENYLEDLIKSAISRMWPLLEGIYINQIQVAIDYMNYACSDALAGYDHGRSNPAKGNYVFHIDQHFLKRYLHFLNGNEAAIPNMNLWEHELVHLMDHWQLVKASTLQGSPRPHNNLEHYLLKYRAEGLANLFDLLDGRIRGISSRAEAKEKLKINYEKAKERILPLKKTSDEDRKELYGGFDFYEIGPWILLDMLDEIFFLEGTYTAGDIEQKIKDGVILSNEEKLTILEKAFLIDNEWFLGRLKLE